MPEAHVSLDATMPQYKLLIQPDGAPTGPSIRAVTPCRRIEVNVMGPTQVASTLPPTANERAVLLARCAETMPGRTMMVDALLRWLAPFQSRLPRLLVDINPADVAGLIPPSGASLTLYNIKAATLDLLEQTYQNSVGTAAGHKVAGSCSLLVALEGLGIGLLLRLLGRNARYLSPDARHVHGFMRNAAIRELRLLSMVYEQADPPHGL